MENVPRDFEFEVYRRPGYKWGVYTYDLFDHYKAKRHLKRMISRQVLPALVDVRYRVTVVKKFFRRTQYKLTPIPR